MKIYMYKDYFLKYISDCPKSLEISSDDFESYEMYPRYKKLYDKKYIAESQNLTCGDQIHNKDIDSLQLGKSFSFNRLKTSDSLQKIISM